MSISNNEKEPIVVSANFWLVTYEKDVDLSYINDLLGIAGKATRKSEFNPAAAFLSHSLWHVNQTCDNIVSMEDAIQKLLEPLYEKKDVISNLINAEGLSSVVTVTVYAGEDNNLPLLLLSKKTIDMMNALHVSEFSIDPFF